MIEINDINDNDTLLKIRILLVQLNDNSPFEYI